MGDVTCLTAILAAIVEVLSVFMLGLFQVINGPASAQDGGGMGAFFSLSAELVAIWLLLVGAFCRLTLEGDVKNESKDAFDAFVLAVLLLVLPIWIITVILRDVA